jgi:hypothetical protein
MGVAPCLASVAVGLNADTNGSGRSKGPIWRRRARGFPSIVPILNTRDAQRNDSHPNRSLSSPTGLAHSHTQWPIHAHHRRCRQGHRPGCWDNETITGTKTRTYAWGRCHMASVRRGSGLDGPVSGLHCVREMSTTYHPFTTGCKVARGLAPDQAGASSLGGTGCL